MLLLAMCVRKRATNACVLQRQVQPDQRQRRKQRHQDIVLYLTCLCRPHELAAPLGGCPKAIHKAIYDRRVEEAAQCIRQPAAKASDSIDDWVYDDSVVKGVARLCQSDCRPDNGHRIEFIKVPFALKPPVESPQSAAQWIGAQLGGSGHTQARRRPIHLPQLPWTPGR